VIEETREGYTLKKMALQPKQLLTGASATFSVTFLHSYNILSYLSGDCKISILAGGSLSVLQTIDLRRIGAVTSPTGRIGCIAWSKHTGNLAIGVDKAIHVFQPEEYSQFSPPDVSATEHARYEVTTPTSILSTHPTYLS